MSDILELIGAQKELCKRILDGESTGDHITDALIVYGYLYGKDQKFWRALQNALIAHPYDIIMMIERDFKHTCINMCTGNCKDGVNVATKTTYTIGRISHDGLMFDLVPSVAPMSWKIGTTGYAQFQSSDVDIELHRGDLSYSDPNNRLLTTKRYCPDTRFTEDSGKFPLTFVIGIEHVTTMCEDEAGLRMSQLRTALLYI